MNGSLDLRNHSQSVWLDYIRRDLVLSGTLKRLAEQDGLSGVTSNPAIFEKAIDGGGQYDEALGTKNPVRDVLYVDELIGPNAVSTIPPHTLDAFRDHGRVRADKRRHRYAITDKLQVYGVASFASAYDRVVEAIGRKRPSSPRARV
jgi:transaldolase